MNTLKNSSTDQIKRACYICELRSELFNDVFAIAPLRNKEKLKNLLNFSDNSQKEEFSVQNEVEV